MQFDRKKLSNEELVSIYRKLLLPRMIEEKMLVLLRQGKISKWFSGIGQEAIAVGNEVSIITGGLGLEASKAFEDQSGVEGVRYFTADNILLKTIVRSNPGIVLWKDGKIVYKWHKKQLPAFSEVKSKYIK